MEQSNDGVHRFKRGKYHGIAFQILGYTFFIISIQQLLLGSIWLMLVLLPLGIYWVFTNEVITVDLMNKTYSEGRQLFGWNVAKMQPLPSIEYVSIFPTLLTQSTTTYPIASKLTTYSQEIRINLIHSRNQRLHIYSSDNRESLLKIAYQFADFLNVGIYDCAGEENVWIKEKPVA